MKRQAADPNPSDQRFPDLPLPKVLPDLSELIKETGVEPELLDICFYLRFRISSIFRNLKMYIIWIQVQSTDCLCSPTGV